MQNIQSIILASIQSLYGLELETSAIEISPAPKPELGEYCINVFPLTRLINESPLSEGEGLGVRWKSPNIIAGEIAIELAKHTDIFKSTSATGGYVNFFLTDTVWLSLFADIGKNGESEGATLSERRWNQKKNEREQSESEFVDPSGAFGTFQSWKVLQKKTIIVDYIGANAGKPLHIAHICTPSIGQVICNVYRHLGYRVIGDSHFGDWGGIFGRIIFAWKNLVNERYFPEYAHELRIFQALELSGDHNWEFEEWKNRKLAEFGINFILKLYQITYIYSWIGDAGTNKDAREEAYKREFKKLSEWDHENTELWQKFTSISIAETEKKLDLLNVHATFNIGESFYEWLDLPRPNNEKYPLLNGENNDKKCTMKDIVKELVDKWIAIDNSIATNGEDKSIGIEFPPETKLPSCVLQKKDGTGLYLTSDLAAIRYRLTNGWNPEKIIYSVDVRQQLHLRQAFWIAQKAWWEELGAKDIEFTHAFNGFIKLKEGAMSTRHGTVIFLEALIDEGNERTEKILEEKWRVGEKILKKEDIQAITIAAIKYSYLAQDREKDVTFDWDKALSFEGNSWPYIQYAYVRGNKLIQDAKWKMKNFDTDTFESWILNLSSFDKSLIQILARFDEVVDTVANTYKPHHLALYAYDVAGVFNSFYVHTPKILEETDAALRQIRLALVSATVKTLSTSFDLLGIQMPSEM